jgi:hypothetical protein
LNEKQIQQIDLQQPKQFQTLKPLKLDYNYPIPDPGCKVVVKEINWRQWRYYLLLNHKYPGTISLGFKLGILRRNFPVFSLNNAAIRLKNGLFRHKAPSFNSQNYIVPGYL